MDTEFGFSVGIMGEEYININIIYVFNTQELVTC